MFGDPAFWSELKKRRVIRVALVYLAVGWGVFEASETLTGVLELPDVTPRLVFALVVLGFPLAVTLAWIYQRTPTGVEREEAYAPAGRFNLAFVGGVAVGVLAVAGLGFAYFGIDRGAVSGALAPDAVAVLPFRVSAPDDLSYLGGGVMDLLSARLDGAVGPSAVDPGAVVRTAERAGDDPRTVATALGAGRVVTGSVVGSASSVVISAEYTGVRDGSLLASAEVEGHPDSLATLADRVLVELLSLSSDEYPSSIAALTSASPDALKAYLRGKEAWRVGDYPASSARFDEALAVDSTFALAALWYVTAARMGWETPPIGDKPEIAWRHRDRLGARDLEYLEATTTLIPRTRAERLAALERLTRDQPDRVEAWYQRGDQLVHSGSMFSVADRMARTWSVWKRALELDPGYRPIFDHMLLVTVQLSPEEKEEFWRALLALQELATYGSLPGVGLSVADDEVAWTLEIEPEALTTNGLITMKWYPVFEPDLVPDDYPTTVDALLRESRRRVGIDISLSSTLNSEFGVHLALGRPERAEEVREEAIREGVRDRLGRTTIFDALWSGVAVDDAEASVAAIDARLAGANGGPLSMTDALDLAAAEIWRYVEDPDHSNPAVAERVRAEASRTSRLDSLRYEAIALLLEGWHEVRRTGASPALSRLVEVLDQGPRGSAVGSDHMLAAARAFEEAGELEMALEMLDRGVGFSRSAEDPYRWREQGRLALAVGDTARAVRHYRHWLKLRVDAEPSVMPEVETVRAELARLGG